MCNHVNECADIGYCDQKYQSFLKDLNVWLAPNGNTAEKALMYIKAESLKRVDWGDIAVIGGITVLATGLCIVCPPATPWVVAGGAAAGALTEGGIEAYRESKTGEYDWRRILIKTLGGSLKGAVASSPIKPLATAVSVGAAGGIEEYLYCLACGESHEQALRSAGINGTLDGITVGGAKFISNKLLVKEVLPKAETKTFKPNIQLFGEQGKEIVGTEFNEIKPTQLEINPERVQYYIDKIKNGQKLDPIPVVNVAGKGKFLLEGHHRYVASKMMGVEIDSIETQGKGPIGLKDWSQVEWTEWNGFNWLYK